MRRGIFVGYTIGVVCAALAVALFVWTTSAWWHEGSVRGLPGGSFWNQNSIGGLEFLFLALGTAAIMVSEFSKAGIRTERGGALGLGVNRVDVTRRSYVERGLWMAVPLVSWAAIVWIPIWLTQTGDPYETPEFGSPSSMWFVIGVNAFAAAGAFGAMASSLVKAAFYDRASRRGRLERQTKGKRKGQLIAPARGQAAMHLLSYQARTELVLGFIAAGTLGVVPYAFFDQDGVPDFAAVAAASALLGLLVAFVIAANSWRSGEKLTAGESLVGGLTQGAGL